MKTERLWPVILAFSLLLAGSISLELVSKHRRAEPLRIRVENGEALLDDDLGDPGGWLFGPPQNEKHERARRMAMRGDYQEALALFAQVEAGKPERPLLRLERAHFLLRSGRASEALTLLERLLPKLGGEPRIWLELAKAQRATGQSEAALATLKQALSRHPHQSRLRLVLGESLRDAGAQKEAIGVLEPAARSGSNDERARVLSSLGGAYMATGAYDKARAALDQAIERAPASVNIWMRVARAHLESTREADSSRALEHALSAQKLAPDLAVVHGLLGRVYEKLGRVSDAVEAYRDAVRLSSDYRFGRTRLLRLGLDLEDTRLARQQAEALLRLDPERPEYHFLAGLSASHAGDLDAARDHYKTAIEHSPDGYPEAWYNVGLLERGAGRPDEAIQAYERAIELRPGYLAAKNNLGLVYLDRGDHESAETAFRSALAIRSSYAPAWTNLARSLSEHEKEAEAIDAYRRAIALRPRERGLTVKLAILLRKTGKAEEAIALYHTLLESDPRYVIGWYNLGIALDAAGQSQDARDAYEKALSLDPDHESALKNLALLETRLGLWADARGHLSDALDRSPADAELRLGLARALLAQNDLPSCSHAARLVLAQEPDSAPARALLKQCSR